MQDIIGRLIERSAATQQAFGASRPSYVSAACVDAALIRGND